MEATAAPLTLRYLGGCPGRSKPEPVTVGVFDDRFELQAGGWGWRIGFDAVQDLGALAPAPDGEGSLVSVRWDAPRGGQTLLLSGRDAVRLRYLLAQGVAAHRAAEEERSRRMTPGGLIPVQGRVVTPWQRELRRMRAFAVGALAVALAALVVVFGVAVYVVGRAATAGHWADDRATLTRLQTDIRLAQERNDPAALSLALQELQDECRRLETYNGDAGNRGGDFTEAQRVCAGAGVTLQ